MWQIKSATRQFMRDRGIPRLLQELRGSALESLFSPDVTLVPVPRSAPLREANARWPGKEIAEELVKAGIASTCHAMLVRVEPVTKSAFAPRGDRPTARRHFETMRVASSIAVPGRVLLVDDVVTKGSTILGAATRLAESFPDAEISAFALLRTLGLQPEVDKILDPVMGIISAHGEEVMREP